MYFGLFAVIFVVVCLLAKATWQDSKSFYHWKWHKKLQIKNRKGRYEYRIKLLLARMPSLKTTYIIVSVFVFIPLISLFFIFWWQIGEFLFGKPTTGIRELSFAFFGTISGLAGVFGVYLAILRSETNERQTRTAEEGLITDRISKATEGLGKNDDNGKPILEVRLGAIYALERIAQDSIRDYEQIMEILCAYIRTNSPNKDKINTEKRLREDILATINIIGRREEWWKDKNLSKNEQPEEFFLNLSKCDLHGARFNSKNLSWATFNETNLQDANLINANLQRAHFKEANLSGVHLHNANLQDVLFHETNLCGSWLSDVDMRRATLCRTDMSNTYISGANLSGMYSEFVNMHDAYTLYAYAHKGDFSTYKNLTQQQLDMMYCGKDVKIPKGLKRPKHWPKDDLIYQEFKRAYTEWREKNS